MLYQVILGQGGQVHLLLGGEGGGGGGGGVVVHVGGGVVLGDRLGEVLEVLVLLSLVTGQQWIVTERSSGQLADIDTNITGLQ